MLPMHLGHVGPGVAVEHFQRKEVGRHATRVPAMREGFLRFNLNIM
jgi:hypothetical protein